MNPLTELRCKMGHNPKYYIQGEYGKSVSFCTKCRTTTPDGNTIINFGYLYYPSVNTKIDINGLSKRW